MNTGGFVNQETIDESIIKIQQLNANYLSKEDYEKMQEINRIIQEMIKNGTLKLPDIKSLSIKI